MINTGSVYEKVRLPPPEEELRIKTNKAILSLEVKISLDQLDGSMNAILSDNIGNSYNVSMKTINQFHEVNSLLDQYASLYGKRPEFEAAKQKWHYLPN